MCAHGRHKTKGKYRVVFCWPGNLCDTFCIVSTIRRLTLMK